MRTRVSTTSGVVAVGRATLQDVDFRRASFDHFLSEGATFVSCDFRGLVLEAKFQPLLSPRRQSVFRDCRFDATDLRALDPGQSRFERCSFEQARIDDWRCATAEFVDCSFAGAVAGVRFYGRPWGPTVPYLDPPRTVNAFHGNDFRRAELVETTFIRGIDISSQRWPEGEAYVRLDRLHHRIARAHAEIIRWRDLEERKDALALLESLSVLYGQQRDIFGRRGYPSSGVSPAVEERVWEILARDA